MDRFYLQKKLNELDCKIIYSYANMYGYNLTIYQANELLKFTKNNFDLIYDTNQYVNLLFEKYDYKTANTFYMILELAKSKLK